MIMVCPDEANRPEPKRYWLISPPIPYTAGPRGLRCLHPRCTVPRPAKRGPDDQELYPVAQGPGGAMSVCRCTGRQRNHQGGCPRDESAASDGRLRAPTPPTASPCGPCEVVAEARRAVDLARKSLPRRRRWWRMRLKIPGLFGAAPGPARRRRAC